MAKWCWETSLTSCSVHQSLSSNIHLEDYDDKESPAKENVHLDFKYLLGDLEILASSIFFQGALPSF